MITMHCTYPNGETAEGNYLLTLAQALLLYGVDWSDTIYVPAEIEDFDFEVEENTVAA
jgi:hypothetical protein